MNRKLRSADGRRGGDAREGDPLTPRRAHTRAAASVCIERAARQPLDSTYSYYYERRNAFCRARTKFVVLRLPIIKIVNAFQFAEVCGVAHRCRASDSRTGDAISTSSASHDFTLRDCNVDTMKLEKSASYVN